MIEEKEIKDLLSFIKANPKTHTIGVSKDNGVFSYCLVCSQAKNSSIVLINTRDSETEFDEEVANLAKYFNAKIVAEV